MASPEDKNNTEDKKTAFKDDKEFYSEKLNSLWGKYLALIYIVITLSGGTLGLIFASIEPSRLEQYDRTDLIIWAIIWAGIALVCSILWRMVAQYFMERETLGSADNLDRYFETYKIPRVTSSGREPKPIALLYKVLYKCLPYLTMACLLASWVAIIMFITANS